MKPDISVDLFKIDEDGHVWTAASKLPDGFRPGDHLVLGDGGDAAPAVARVVDMGERWVRFHVLAGPAEDHRHLLRGRPAA
ncbi:MAG: hypothetical protein WD250_15525 [Egibacteraceae bacterium]